jgi:UDP-N-acetylglucosamine 2-epimerase (non-hydrolysing)
MIRVLSVFGTRPEAIKMAPVVRELQRYPDRIESLVCVTAQHREMLDQVLALFAIAPDYDLEVMEDSQTPTQVASAVLARLEPILQREQPDWVLVQGDTATVAAASLAAFYAGVKVGHVEAGLRTHDKRQPFPEEINRRVAGVIADLHFAPTQRARQNLLHEGVPAEHIVVTGNPVIDALHWAAAQPLDAGILDLDRATCQYDGLKQILVTAHRRENLGRPLENICLALRDLASHYDGRVHITYPVHLNPNVWVPVHRLLGDVLNITLTPPLDYLPLVHLMKRAHLILTDSGGIQEEAPGLGVPVLVLREVTERPEAVEAGAVRVVALTESGL